MVNRLNKLVEAVRGDPDNYDIDPALFDMPDCNAQKYGHELADLGMAAGIVNNEEAASLHAALATDCDMSNGGWITSDSSERNVANAGLVMIAHALRSVGG